MSEIATRVPPDLMGKVERQAKEECCSFQSVVLRALSAYFAEEVKDGSNRDEDSSPTS